ncbi:hypothetical protein Bbelb_336130 [Branchiostoma belcheri]|nr:hypothetical protein Bbelb_336130 [Branchiostoma belcheri]
MCRNLPYKQTMYPKGTGNALGHRTQEDAVRFIAQHQLQRLVESDCSPDLRLFFCSVFVPACTPTGEIVPPCRTLCQATRQSCRGVLQRENIRWPRELQCGRYPIPGTGKGCTEGLQSAQHSAGGQHQVGITPLSANEHVDMGTLVDHGKMGTLEHVDMSILEHVDMGTLEHVHMGTVEDVDMGTLEHVHMGTVEDVDMDEEPVMVHTMDYLTEFKKPSAELVRGVRGQAVLLRGKYLESDQPLNVCGQKYVFCPDGFAVEFWMKRWLNDKRPHYYVDIGGDRTELARGFTFLRARDQVDREDQFTVQVSGSRTAQRGRVDIPLQTWTHVAFFWKEGSQLTILVNGTRAGYNFEERRLKPLTRRARGNPYRLFYGTSAMRPGGMTPSYTALDEVKIWGYVRPEEDIKQSLDEFLADTEGVCSYHRNGCGSSRVYSRHCPGSIPNDASLIIGHSNSSLQHGSNVVLLLTPFLKVKCLPDFQMSVRMPFGFGRSNRSFASDVVVAMLVD